MRRCHRKLGSFIFLIATSASVSLPAQTVELLPGQSLDDALLAARRDLEVANIELRLYRQVEFPRKRREFDAQVKIVLAEVDSFKRLVREYKSFNVSRYSNAFLFSRQRAELALLDAELRLKNLREERSAFRRFHTDHCRLYELKVEAARARVLALDRLRYGQ
jgi:hypothetical protein